ncbi:MAG: DegV family protein [Chloroflexi bacterium]|jgi:DegV family protein with EDD domain|nr:DegV family protein [Chloroflexota bacterium]MBT3668857.1 DegV family protein [Chloroflexota bacterium]MBT4306571.1 DegV family protein [Chloroflexota bacterium]MBT4533955.1 DegV family protein [Chloroflexota bacterium]MBT4681442.1 DegV family protein [Chloroflexota bacterium]
MAKKVAIVTDSTANVPPAWLDEFNISVTPMTVIWGGEELADGVDISPEEFFVRLSNEKVMPSTSQPTPGAMKVVYEGLAAEGYDILSIHISSKLSGTMNSALQAKEMLPKLNIEVVDTLSASVGECWSILKAAQAAKAGKNLAECKAIAVEASKNTYIALAVDTLEFLHRGGRIGGAQRYLGAALNLKPILEVTEEGSLDGIDRVRTSKKAHIRLVEIIKEKIGDRSPVYIGMVHSVAEENAKKVLAMLEEELDIKESIISWVSPGIGVHTGPGMVGISFMAGIE